MTNTRREFLATGLSAVSGAVSVGALSHSLASAVVTDERSLKVDCHTHFYDPTRPEGVPWPGKQDDVLYRPRLPQHFLKEAESTGVTKTVVVEASPLVEDNAWLLELAAKNSSVIGVVGNLTPGKPEFAEHLKRFAKNKLYRGIRINHSLLRSGLDQPEFLADIRRLEENNLELDVNGGPEMPADVARLAAKIPELRIVINHLGNVDVDGSAPPDAWRKNMLAAAEHKNVFCKVSALVEHAKPKSGDTGKIKVPDDVEFYRPVLDAIWKTFGDDRLIYGSNWPVSDRAATYRQLFSIVDQYVQARGRIAADKLFWQNAKAAYQWPAG